MSDCLERRHVHVDGNGEGIAKFWLEPVSLADHVGYSPRQIQRIRSIVEHGRADLVKGFDTTCQDISR